MPFATALKNARKQAKLTQSELAKKIGKSQTAIYQWENRKRFQIEFETVCKLEEALNLPEGSLLNLLPEEYLEKKTMGIVIPVVGYAGAGPDVEIPVTDEVIRFGNEASTWNACRVRGDSMVGSLIADGDYVVYTPGDAKPGDLVVAWIAGGQGGHVVKKLSARNMLVSTSPDFKSYRMREGDRIVGVVKLIIRKI